MFNKFIRITIEKELLFCLVFTTFSLSGQIQLDTISNTNFHDISAIEFETDEIGVVADDSLVHYTIDEGATWRHKPISNMVSGAVSVSIQGNDTLFVVADGKYQRVRYFHGFNGQPTDLYIDSNEIQNWYPSIAKNGSNILIAGGFVDSLGESFLLRTQDHGSSWHRVYSSRITGRMVAVEHRQLDTFLINFNPIDRPFERGKSYYFYNNGDITGLSWPALDGVRSNCYGNTCLGYKERDVFIHRGPVIYNANRGFDTYGFNYEDENVRLVLNAPDEFVYVLGDRDSLGVFKIVMHQFSLAKGSNSLVMFHTVTDTAEYSFFDSQALSHIPGGICRSANYVYFTIAPKIYRIKSSSIGLNFYNHPKRSLFSVGYNQNNGELHLFDLEDFEDYEAVIYSLSGKIVWSGAVNTEHSVIPFDSNPVGIYFVNLRDNNGNVGSVKFIKY